MLMIINSKKLRKSAPVKSYFLKLSKNSFLMKHFCVCFYRIFSSEFFCTHIELIKEEKILLYFLESVHAPRTWGGGATFFKKGHKLCPIWLHILLRPFCADLYI